MIREGFFKTIKYLDRAQIEEDLAKTRQELDKECADYKDEFIGAAVVVFDSQ